MTGTGLGLGEILIVFLIAYVVVGPKDMKRAVRKLAGGIREIKRMGTEMKGDLDLDNELLSVREAVDRTPAAGGAGELSRIHQEIDKEYRRLDDAVRAPAQEKKQEI
jgi:Sec-independent protein translocase protein TatA